MSSRYFDGSSSRPVFPIVLDDLISRTIERPDDLFSLWQIPSSDLKRKALVSYDLSSVNLKSADRYPMISGEFPGTVPEGYESGFDFPICRTGIPKPISKQTICLSSGIVPKTSFFRFFLNQVDGFKRAIICKYLRNS